MTKKAYDYPFLFFFFKKKENSSSSHMTIPLDVHNPGRGIMKEEKHPFSSLSISLFLFESIIGENLKAAA
jgi:hypothetical protein